MKIQVIQHVLQVKKLRLYRVKRESRSPIQILSRKHNIGSLLELRAQSLHLLKKKKTNPTGSSTVVADPTMKELKHLSDFFVVAYVLGGGRSTKLSNPN